MNMRLRRALALFLLCGVALTAFTGCAILSAVDQLQTDLEGMQSGSGYMAVREGYYYGTKGTDAEVYLLLEALEEIVIDYGGSDESQKAALDALESMIQRVEGKWTLVNGEETVSGSFTCNGGSLILKYADPERDGLELVYASGIVRSDLITLYCSSDGHSVTTMYFKFSEGE